MGRRRRVGSEGAAVGRSGRAGWSMLSIQDPGRPTGTGGRGQDGWEVVTNGEIEAGMATRADPTRAAGPDASASASERTSERTSGRTSGEGGFKAALARELRARPFGYMVLLLFVLAGPIGAAFLFPQAPVGVAIFGGLAFGIYAALCAVPQKFM